jgi:glycine C-acetyltransferase
MYDRLQQRLTQTLDQIRSEGLYKGERVLVTPQSPHVELADGRRAINFCSNNYLGLANDPQLLEAAKASFDEWGYGLSSVRFICGTQTLHKQLEEAISQFLGTEDTILYSSCFDANGGLFETLLGPDDAVISDELNHASVIDGIRLCKAQRYRYANGNMSDLKAQLTEAESRGAKLKLIATDGVFSMDGLIANLDEICDLGDQFGAAVMVDDSHATGFMGRTGRGTPEQFGVSDRVEIITSTFGKALGGASGGFTSGRREIVELLRQRSRPYLFSNTLAPVIAATTLRVIATLSESTELRDKLEVNTKLFRSGMIERGFEIPVSNHPICPIMLGDARVAKEMADRLLNEGVYVIGFSYPVVPKGKARIRVQVSASHSQEDLHRAMEAFAKVRAEMRAPSRRDDR